MSKEQLMSVHAVVHWRADDTTTDSSGALRRTYERVGTKRCRLSSTSGASSNRYGKEGLEKKRFAYFAFDPEMGRNDVMVFKGKVLEVAGVASADDEAPPHLKHWKVTCEEIEQRQPFLEVS